MLRIIRVAGKAIKFQRFQPYNTSTAASHSGFNNVKRFGDFDGNGLPIVRSSDHTNPTPCSLTYLNNTSERIGDHSCQKILQNNTNGDNLKSLCVNPALSSLIEYGVYKLQGVSVAQNKQTCLPQEPIARTSTAGEISQDNLELSQIIKSNTKNIHDTSLVLAQPSTSSSILLVPRVRGYRGGYHVQRLQVPSIPRMRNTRLNIASASGQNLLPRLQHMSTVARTTSTVNRGIMRSIRGRGNAFMSKREAQWLEHRGYTVLW